MILAKKIVVLDSGERTQLECVLTKSPNGRCINIGMGAGFDAVSVDLHPVDLLSGRYDKELSALNLMWLKHLIQIVGPGNISHDDIMVHFKERIG